MTLLFRIEDYDLRKKIKMDSLIVQTFGLYQVITEEHQEPMMNANISIEVFDEFEHILGIFHILNRDLSTVKSFDKKLRQYWGKTYRNHGVTNIKV